MLKQVIVRMMLVGLFVISMLAISACGPTARTERLTGDADVHERHATGFDSQTSE